MTSITLSLSNARRNPSCQEFWVSLDIGGKVEHLLASEG
jgi:hypothetical protein